MGGREFPFLLRNRTYLAGNKAVNLSVTHDSIFHTLLFRLVMRLLKVNTRLMAIMGTTVSLLGVFIIADWQSIAHDPCTQFSLFHHPELADEYNASYSIPDSPLASIGVHSQQQGARVVIEFNAHIQQLLVFQESVYNIARNKCEEARVSKHNCHWIPSSSITKELCMDCQPICRSVDRTLTFAQFLIGAILLEFFQPIARVSVTAMLSDQVNRDFQVRSQIWLAFVLGKYNYL